MSNTTSSSSKGGGHPFTELASKSVISQLQDFESSIEAMYDLKLPPPPTTTTSSSSSEAAAAVLETSSSQSIVRVTWDDVSIDGVLGEGGFSFIFRARHIQQQQLQQQQQQQLHHPSCTSTDYALKCLKAKSIRTEQDLVYNAMDLYTEGFLLSRLCHPNIIGLHGVSYWTLADSFLKSDGYFVLLDVIHSTLYEELEKWRTKTTSTKRNNKSSPSKNIYYDNNNKEVINITSARTKVGIVERIRDVILPVVDAMEYLHEFNIVLRDLKPENIGFDQTGRVKLFDFGLARNVTSVELGDIAGSICYMAPEIMLQTGTYLSSDVYSFSIILWEICSLQIPLVDFIDFESVKKRVAIGSWRPSCTKIPSKAIRTLIKQCWDKNHTKRPSFVEIEERLYRTIDKHDGVGVVDGFDSSSERIRLKRRMSGVSQLSASSRHSVMTANF